VFGSVHYHEADDAYREARLLDRVAGVGSLWALGVGAAISGSFVGWHFGLAEGGFGGLLIATVLIAAMYAGACSSIAEMAAALPHSGGAYFYGRLALGRWGGLIAGLGQNIAFVLLPAVMVLGIGGYLGAIFGTPDGFAPIWWLVTYVTFVGLNIWGAEVAFKSMVAFTAIALVVLVLFALGAFPHFSWDQALSIEPSAVQHSRFLPEGLMGIVFALPFAVWFFLAVEQVPLAAEESLDPGHDLPRAILLAVSTLVPVAFLILILSAGMAPGAAVLGISLEPLVIGFKTIFGAAAPNELVSLVALAGLIASFHAVMFAYGRNIYVLSRAGYFPPWLSVTRKDHKTPHRALIAGAVIGYLVAVLIHFSVAIFDDFLVGGVLLNMAVFGAVISILVQVISFILLRERLPELHRPFSSPLGLPGAWTALAIALVTLVVLFLSPDFRVGLWGCLIWYALAAAYYLAYGRRHLTLSPEEKFAADVESRQQAEQLKESTGSA
jgi:ethanolamine permease